MSRSFQRVSLAIVATVAFMIPMGAQGQAKPYVFADIVTLLESGLSPARVARRLEASCYAGEITAPQIARLRALNATTELLDALRASTCAKSAPEPSPPPASRPPAPPAPTSAAPATVSTPSSAPVTPAPDRSSSAKSAPEPSPVPMASAAPRLLELRLTPSVTSIEVGASLTLLPEVKDGSGWRAYNGPLAWSSTETSILGVEAGQVRAVGIGQASVIVQGKGVVTTSVTIIVESPRPARIAVTADTRTIPVGETTALAAMVVSAAGIPISSQLPACAVSRSCVRYAVSDSSMAEIVEVGTTRLLRGLKPGSVTVVASIDGGVRDEARVEIGLPRVTSLRLSPEMIALQPGAQQRVAWKASGVAGEIDSVWVGPPEWRSSNETVAIIQEGLITALSEGQANLTVRIGEVESGPVTITVRKPVRLAALSPTIDTLRGRSGQSLTVGVRAIGSNAAPFDAPDIEWVASDTNALQLQAARSSDRSVSSSVSVIAKTPGVYSLLASSNGVRSTPITVIVTSPVATPPVRAPRVTLVSGSDSLRLSLNQSGLLSVAAVLEGGKGFDRPWTAEWTSNNPAVVRVSAARVDKDVAFVTITGVRAGVAEVTTKTDIAGTARFIVTVTNIDTTKTNPAQPEVRVETTAPGDARPVVPTTAPAGPTEPQMRAIIDGLIANIAERDSTALSNVLAGSEPGALRTFFKTISAIRGTPAVTVADVQPVSATSTEPSATIRITWRGSFGGEVRTARLVFVARADGTWGARVRDR